MGLKLDFIADKSLCSNVGLVRKANEDNCGFAQTPNGNLFVVCDGMGGHVGGATASKIGVDKIIEYLSKEKYSNIKQALNDALVFANMQILGTAKENPELKGMGTTACILLVTSDEAWIAHAGDSRIYLYADKENLLHRITKDHSFVQGLIDSGEIRDEDAENHPQKNIILKALGIKEDIKPTVCARPVLPAKNDIFLICSDGLSGMIDDATIESVLRKNASLEKKVNELIDLALENGGKDNVTAQLIRLAESQYKITELNGNDYTPAYRKPSKSKSVQWAKIAAAAALALVLIIGGYIGIDYYKNVKPTKVEIKKLEDKIADFKKQDSRLKDSIDHFNKLITLIEGTIDNQTKQLNINKTATKNTETIANLEAEIQSEKEEIEQLKSQQDELDARSIKLNDSITKWQSKIDSIKTPQREKTEKTEKTEKQLHKK
ncbi:MAG: Stp1/IreP family PP2C-type Ser/Thr phosphatase [Prevotellaceae bacterium]|jgi:protein phosphatase|nr:Stp1/IreP family PP2C-type Ser/Thr phosphatase [Prevotellaceae bacterium]